MALCRWMVFMVGLAGGVGCAFDEAGIDSLPGTNAMDPEMGTAGAGRGAQASVPPVVGTALADTQAPVDGIVLAVPRGNRTLFLDGSLNEWNDIPWQEFGPKLGGELGGQKWDRFAFTYAPSIDVRFGAMADASNLYLAFVIEDDRIFADSAFDSYWDDDSLEIYIDALADASGPYGDDDFVLWVRANAIEDCSPDSFMGYPLVCRGSRTSSSTGTTWIVEMSVPLNGLGVTLGDRVGFGVAVNDDDGRLNYPGFDDNATDAYVPWFLSKRAPCSTCCDDSPYAPHPQPWCDTSRLGELFLP